MGTTSISTVTYSRKCELCDAEVILDLGDSEEAQRLGTLVFTSSDVFGRISDKLGELMEEHLEACHSHG